MEVAAFRVSDATHSARSGGSLRSKFGPEMPFWPGAVANCTDLGYFTNQLVNYEDLGSHAHSISVTGRAERTFNQIRASQLQQWLERTSNRFRNPGCVVEFHLAAIIILEKRKTSGLIFWPYLERNKGTHPAGGSRAAGSLGE